MIERPLEQLTLYELKCLYNEVTRNMSVALECEIRKGVSQDGDSELISRAKKISALIKGKESAMMGS
jgi:hypothetical protein